MTSTKTNKPAPRPKRKLNTGDFKIRNLKYYLTETFRSLVRNKIMTLTSVATVAACLFIVMYSYVIASNINAVLNYLETSIGITVFVDDALDASQVEMLHQELLRLDNVTGTTFIPPEEALANMAEILEDTDGILAALDGPNPLRRSFTIELGDIRQQRQTVDEINRLYGVANVREAAGVTDGLITLNNFIFIFSFVVMLILGVLAVVIITNTIKLTVNNRRNEIIIMKYVGATDWFIKWPFVIEGILIGMVGAIIPITIAWLTYDGLMDNLRDSEFAMFVQLPFRTAAELFPLAAPITVILGVGIGVLGSVSAMRRYLSV